MTTTRKVDVNLKSMAAQNRKRDDHGHFIKTKELPTQATPNESQNPLTRFLSQHTSYSKDQDDILDIHIGNPLRRIADLLQQIKDQKAFAFTLKGSLGIAGVILTLSVFGIFGGGKILCDRGNQTEIGTVKVLNVFDSDPSTVPFISSLINRLGQKSVHKRVVLIKDNATVVRLPFSQYVDLAKFDGNSIIVTGHFDSCAQSLIVDDQSALEPYPKP